MSRILNLLLATVTIAGVIASIYAKLEQRPLRKEYEQLEAAVGVLDVADPDQFHIRSIPNDDPYHFAWRVYKPANVNLKCQTLSPSGSSGSLRSGPASESIFRLRFRFTDNSVQTYFKHNGGASTSAGGDAKTAAFLREHWEQLKITDICQDGAVDTDQDQVMTLLKISVPEDLHDELGQALGENSKLLRSPIILVQIGAGAAFNQAATTTP